MILPSSSKEILVGPLTATEFEAAVRWANSLGWSFKHNRVKTPYSISGLLLSYNKTLFYGEWQYTKKDNYECIPWLDFKKYNELCGK